MFIHNRLGMVESAEGLLAQEQRLNQVSNNLANVDTAGYKQDNVTFWEMLYTTGSERQRVGKGLKVTTDYSQGVINMTGNPLDLAINGDGFFKVQTPNGVRYTRAGNFFRNSQNQLTTADGNLVLGQGGPIVLQGNTIKVGRDGSIMADGEEIGRIAVVTFDNIADLVKEGASLFRTKDAGTAEIIPQNFTVEQGSLEKTNVNSVAEMTEMIDLLRSFEAQQKVVSAIDGIDDQAIRRVGRLTA